MLPSPRGLFIYSSVLNARTVLLYSPITDKTKQGRLQLLFTPHSPVQQLLPFNFHRKMPTVTKSASLTSSFLPLFRIHCVQMVLLRVTLSRSLRARMCYAWPLSVCILTDLQMEFLTCEHSLPFIVFSCCWWHLMHVFLLLIGYSITSLYVQI